MSSTGFTEIPNLVGVGDEGSVLSMPMQHIYLQLADPWTTPDYTEITPLVKQWSGTVRGRQHELQLFQPGQVAITMEGNLNQGRFNPWNTLSPYTTLFRSDDAAQLASNGTWANAVHATLEPYPTTPPVELDIGYALEIKCNGTSPSSIATGSLSYTVTAGNTYSAMCSFLAGATSRACTVGIQWYNVIDGLISTTTSSIVDDIPPATITNVAAGSDVATITASNAFSAGDYVTITGLTTTQLNGTWLISSASGSSFTFEVGSDFSISSTSDSGIAGVWTKASLLGAVAPGGAHTAAIIITINSGASNEIHWACRAALFNYTGNVPNTAWAPGQRGLVPGRPMYCTAYWSGILHDVWSMYISNLTPAYGQVKSEMVINCSDGLARLSLGDIYSTAYENQVLADGAQSYWKCGDAPLSLLALDSGPNNSPMNAFYMDFGLPSPLLTDDTTVAGFSLSSSSAPGYLLQNDVSLYLGAGGSLEFIFQMPTQTTETLLYGSTDGSAYIAFAPDEDGGLLGVSSVGFASPAIVNAVAPQCDDGTWHHLVVTWTSTFSGTLTVYLDGVSVGSALSGFETGMFETGSPFIFGSQVFGGTPFTYNGEMGNIATYQVCLSPTHVANHFNLFDTGFAEPVDGGQYSGLRIQSVLNGIGWPSYLQNIAKGISIIQGATSSLTQTSALSYFQSVESTEMGALFIDPAGIITFYDRHYIITATAATISNGRFPNEPSSELFGTYFRYMPGLVPAMDDTDLWNDVPAQRNGGVLQRSTNLTRVKQYLKRTLTGYTGELQITDAEVLAQTQWLLAHYDTPYTRCRSMTLSSRTDAGKNLDQMLGRGIFDNITLVWNPIDGSLVYFNQDSLIESIQHSVTQSEWITTWGLSPAETQPYMVLNDPILGQLSTNNRLAY